MVVVRIALLVFLTLTAACAPRLSAEQELTWDAYKACQAEGPSTTLETVRETGGSVIRGRETEVFKVGSCMSEYRRKAILEGRSPAVPAVFTVNPAPRDASGLVVPEAPAWSVGDRWRF